jgi:hypothetical protein
MRPARLADALQLAVGVGPDRRLLHSRADHRLLARVVLMPERPASRAAIRSNAPVNSDVSGVSANPARILGTNRGQFKTSIPA